MVLPLLQGPIAGMIWGSLCSCYTLAKVVQPFEVLALCSAPWRPKQIRNPRYTCYADAAKSHEGHKAIVWGPNQDAKWKISLLGWHHSSKPNYGLF